ncbi:sensor histidine kinase [Mesorhizobium sp.]|uniref:sensor histidine kinase n=1 Tax=Mesorhizobium sp. TaxID=1871066 RepID=UPI003BAA0E1D
MIAIVAALLLAAMVIAIILQRFVVGQIDQRLDAQIFAISSALQRDGDGKITVTPALSGPPYDRPQSGWAWQVSWPSGDLVSTSLAAVGPVKLPSIGPDRVDNLLGLRDWFGLLRSLGRPKSVEGEHPDGQALHWRILEVPFGGETVTIAAGAPYHAISGPLREALLPLGLALLTLGILLFGALFAQVRLGLRPLADLRTGLADIRAGRRNALPGDQPSEVQPLVDEVNSLLAENAEGLARARRHVANLAHGLKTPLAALGLALERRSFRAVSAEVDTDNIDTMRAQLDVMERLIRHHLARARVAALSGPARASTNVSERLADLAGMMNNIHRERALSFKVSVPTGLSVAVETQDFDEILGNILDNACKWAASGVVVGASDDQGQVMIIIEDDGPGLDPAAMPEAMRPGRRIDEATPGHGFGLPIAAELTELYGGSLVLERVPGTGLRVQVRLPKAPRS